VVNFRLAPPEIVYVINDAKARLLFVGPEFAAPWTAARQLPTASSVSSASAARPTTTKPGWPRTHPTRGCTRQPPTDCFVQLYTSGTTGFPKGAMLTHRGMLAHARNVSASQDLGTDARVQVAMPLFHVGGTSYALMAMTRRCAHPPDAPARPGRARWPCWSRADHAHLLRAGADGGDERRARCRRARLFVAEGAVVRRVADAAAGDARVA
jgi:acyl-coenzyme A synthetase/AMP-(fatty) acid ligase